MHASQRRGDVVYSYNPQLASIHSLDSVSRLSPASSINYRLLLIRCLPILLVPFHSHNTITIPRVVNESVLILLNEYF